MSRFRNKVIMASFILSLLLCSCSTNDSDTERGKYDGSVETEKMEKNVKDTNTSKESRKDMGDIVASRKESTDSSNKKETDDYSSNKSESKQSIDTEQDESEKIYYNSMPEDRQTIINNISIETEHNNERLMVVLTNNNDFVIPDLSVQAVFYKDGQMVGSDKDGHDVVLPGHSVASRLDIPETAQEFDVSVTVNWDYGTGYRNWTDQVAVQSNKGEKCVMISFTNNSDVDIRELEYVVALYKNGKFVDIMHPRDVYDFYSGSTIVEEASTYSTDFDDYKIFINQAHTF